MNRPCPVSRKLKLQYKLHWNSFYNLLHCKPYNPDEIAIFPYTEEGFLKFIDELGIPNSLINHPSLARKDHRLPHIPGNICWQEREYNIAESHFRNHWLHPAGYRHWNDVRKGVKEQVLFYRY
jgi:hypothetical protein